MIRRFTFLALVSFPLLLVGRSSSAQVPTGLSAETATVEGRITARAGGESVSGAWVLLESETRTVNPPAVQTGEDGSFRLTGVPADVYHLRVEAAGFRMLETRKQARLLPIRVAPGAVVRSDHQLSRGATIAVEISDPAGEPIAATVWAEFTVYENGRLQRRRVPPQLPDDPEAVRAPNGNFADEEGRFAFEGLGEGEYYLAAYVSPYSPVYFPGTTDPGRAVPIAVTRDAEVRGDTLGGIGIQWLAVPMVPLRGQIQGIDDPEDFTVRFDEDLHLSPMVPVDADGRFEALVPPGQTYDLLVSRGGLRWLQIAAAREEARAAAAIAAPRRMTRDAGTASVYVGEDGVDDLVIAVRPSHDLDVEFIWESTPTPGFVWNQVDIALDRQSGSGMSSYRISAEDARTRIQDVEPLEQRLRIDGLPPDVYVESAFHGSTDILREEFDPTANPDTPVRVLLGNQPARIEGVVTVGIGDPSPGTVVTLVPDADHRGRPDLLQTTVSDDDGAFTFETVAPGTYRVFAWASIPEGAIESEEFRLPFEPRSTRVLVDRRGVAEVEVVRID